MVLIGKCQQMLTRIARQVSCAFGLNCQLNDMEPEGVSAVSIHLFKHNQAAYEAAVSMMEREGKAAVIHPTGTGKSFIAFKLADEHPDARICWLAPSEYIYHTQLENVKRTLEPEEELHTENIFFYSFSYFIIFNSL